MSRSIRRRVLLAAALPAAVLGCALPAAAHADTIAFVTGNTLVYTQTPSEAVERNTTTLRVADGEISITDVVPLTATSPCRLIASREARCPADVASVLVRTSAGNDHVTYRLPHTGSVALGAGSDTVSGGRREAIGRPIRPVSYVGDEAFGEAAGQDTIAYGAADRGVTINVADGLANDGRPGDLENVADDFEVIQGSVFADTLFAGSGAETIIPLLGDDVVAGGEGEDRFVTFAADGADDYHGGPGRDTIDYSVRTQPVAVDLDNAADDGADGERDNVRSNVENILGGSAGDRLRSFGAFSRLDGGAGDDTLLGDAGPDTLIGGRGIDLLSAGTGNDVVDARDTGADDVDCGPDDDSLLRDFAENETGCESFQVGTLRLTPKVVHAAAGTPARIALRWRHPRHWQRLRSIVLRLDRDGAEVGQITIRPRTRTISTDGAVDLVPTSNRLTRNGKTLTARLALRLDPSLAGRRLAVEVEATDTRGRRQLERDVGTVRLAR